jgi:ubiquinone biosynthesis protein COQ9
VKPHSDPFDPDRRRILDEALKSAPFEGFTPLMLRKAAAAAGLRGASLAAAFPAGPIGLVEFWSSEADAASRAAVAGPGAASLRIREKVALGVEARIAYLAPHKEAARRAGAYLALPHNAPTAARFAFNAADAIWRGLNDPSTDFNFYTKRAILTGVIASTMARWFADDSADGVGWRSFLAARIENVMQFEKLKARVKDNGFDPDGMLGWFARLRYPERR